MGIRRMRLGHAAVLLLALACLAAVSLRGQWGAIPPDATAALCVIALNEAPYIHEWIAYHLALGFDAIYVYDNSDDNELRDLPAAWPGRVVVTHFPSPRANDPSPMQLRAYNACLEACRGRHTWLGFLDVDEFLVLRRHRDVKSLLREHCPRGALGVNWLMFGTGGRTTYEPGPVRARFTTRDREVNHHIKAIALVQDAAAVKHVHYPELVPGATMRDTSGTPFTGPFNPGGPTDVAVIHHYYTKSEEEFRRRRPWLTLPSPPADPVEDRSALEARA